MQQGLSIATSRVMPTARATGLFTWLLTVLEAPTLANGGIGSNGVNSGSFVAVSALSSIPCMSAPSTFARVAAAEAKAPDQILSTEPRHVLLNDIYSDVRTYWLTGAMANITDADGLNGVNVDILGVECDSQRIMTRLEVRKASI